MCAFFFSKGAELIAVTMLFLVWDSYLLATAFRLAQSSIDSLGNWNPSKIFPLSMCRKLAYSSCLANGVLILNRIYWKGQGRGQVQVERLLLHFLSLVASAVPTETFVRKTKRGSWGIDPPAESERPWLIRLSFFTVRKEVDWRTSAYEIDYLSPASPFPYSKYLR